MPQQILPHSIPPSEPTILSYVVGLALGDGNLSNPNGRATRLRITCDSQYPKLISKIKRSIQIVAPKNRVSIVKKKGRCVDISCYSNRWEDVLGWKALGGSKYAQNVSIPSWIKDDDRYSIACIRGLIETDGCIYNDRGYTMVNFVSIIPPLVNDFIFLIKRLGFDPSVSRLERIGTKPRYTVRITKDVDRFLDLVGIEKK